MHRASIDAADVNAGDAFFADLDRIPETFLESGGEFLVGFCEGHLVAMGGFEPIGGTRAELKRMRVDPAYQRMGFGRALLDALEKQARELGFESLYLETTLKQAAARGLYRSQQYQETERGWTHGYPVVRMEKKLA